MVRISIKGLEKAIRDIKDAQKKIHSTTMDAIAEVVDKMIEEARKNAPEDLRNLIDSIGKEYKDGWTIVFFVGEEYGAFMEFGLAGLRNISSNLDIPEEMEAEARKFKGYKGGDFKQFVKDIEAWCGRKGIDPEAAYPIAVSILNNGLQARPYFYPAYLKYKDEIIKLVEKRLQELFNKMK